MMKMRNLLKLFIGVFASALLLTSNLAFAEPTLPEVYQAIEAGQLAKADAMMQEVLKNHPNSGKAHYIASELYLKEGKLDAARNAFTQAENLAPGLPFAQPDSVQRLQTQLRAGTVPAQTNTGAGSIFTSPIFWILIAILIAGIVFFMRKRPQPVQVYNAPTANGPYPGAPGGYPSGYPGAPASGMGGGLMGSLATGAALGAGMVAGEALASHLMGGGNHMNPGVNNDFNQVGGQVPDASNFGVNDTSSWDDGGASSWDDSGGGGGFMDDV
ncbi:tetratricopeptide repeat protein [Polynucleobacter sp. TSB-Sco08W16]|uniref:tetratricopeptide repeat protein n=1 Tax=Polynucleobacter sp. TSB-Sco08W16 TaxID=1758374 RepID=UPI0020413575|nr:tetratricopeptide repeat protein [Polynucleobacter sp. TSB-Sco08W16]